SLLCLSLSTAVQAGDAAMATDKPKADGSDWRQGGQEAGEKQMPKMESSKPREYKTIRGEVLRVEGNDCFIKGQDGREVQGHVDLTTLKARNIESGEQIEAKVDDQNHVIEILSNPAFPDRRNEKE